MKWIRNHSRSINKTVSAELSEIVFILDRSGSMAGLEADTIGGFNSMLEKQKQLSGRAFVSTVLFDNECETIHDRMALELVPRLTEREYSVRGCTALLDAVGKTIEHVDMIHRYAREEDRPGRTLFVITTDGMENCSRDYSYDRVRSLIESHKEKGWEFLFLGANIDAAREAARFGIDASRTANYRADSRGTEVIYDSISETIEAFRCCPCGSIDESWKDKIDADYACRGEETVF